MTRWPDGSSSSLQMRVIVATCAGLLAWAHATYPFDHFLGEATAVERTLTVILALLTIWRPFFLLPYVFLPILAHFGEPVLIHNWSVTELPSGILLLSVVQLMVWLAFPQSRWQTAPLPIDACCRCIMVGFCRNMVRLGTRCSLPDATSGRIRPRGFAARKLRASAGRASSVTPQRGTAHQGQHMRTGAGSL